jgi:hypothetical protein
MSSCHLRDKMKQENEIFSGAAGTSWGHMRVTWEQAGELPGEGWQ